MIMSDIKDDDIDSEAKAREFILENPTIASLMKGLVDYQVRSGDLIQEYLNEKERLNLSHT